MSFVERRPIQNNLEEDLGFFEIFLVPQVHTNANNHVLVISSWIMSLIRRRSLEN